MGPLRIIIATVSLWIMGLSSALAFEPLPPELLTRINYPPFDISRAQDLPARQKARAEMLITIFENESLHPQYGAIVNLHDGRGYTAGWAGFCTGTGDLLVVVETYTKVKPKNSLARYLPRLRVLADRASDSVSGLSGFVKAWKREAQDPLFQKVQVQVSDFSYFRPAMDHAVALHVHHDFSKVAIYEAIIQHGDSEKDEQGVEKDPDSLGGILDRAAMAVGGTPATGINEMIWLRAFLRARKSILENPSDQASRKEWQGSVGRADAMLKILDEGNLDFKGPITVDPFGDAFTIP